MKILIHGCPPNLTIALPVFLHVSTPISQATNSLTSNYESAIVSCIKLPAATNFCLRILIDLSATGFYLTIQKLSKISVTFHFRPDLAHLGGI